MHPNRFQSRTTTSDQQEQDDWKPLPYTVVQTGETNQYQVIVGELSCPSLLSIAIDESVIS
jgi:hypothetical protein